MGTYENPYLARYNDPSAKPATGDRGQVVDPLLLTARRRIEPHVIEIAPRLRSLVGFGLSATHVITGDDGLIVVDTGAGVDEGREKLERIRTFSHAPVRSVIYTHFHYASGTEAFIPEDGRLEIYAHPNLDRNHAQAVSELATVKHRRIAAQAGHTLPATGSDADSAGTTVSSRGAHGYRPPTQTIVHNGQELLINGVRFVFYTVYPFDTDCTLLIWAPDLQTVIHNHMSGNFPNVYSIGGGPFRDPRPWLAGLDKIRGLAPQNLLGCHGLPFIGTDDVSEAVTVTRDALQFVFDQTVRAMNRGLSAAEAIDVVRLPDVLADHPVLTQTYGEVWHHVMSIYHGLIGWYDGDAVNLLPVAPSLAAERVTDAFGGPDRALDAAAAALDQGEIGWAARLARDILRVAGTGPTAERARRVEAAALRRGAHLTTAWGTRNALLTQARELEGLPGRASLTPHPTAAMLEQSPPAASMEFLRVRFAPERAENASKCIVVKLTEDGGDSGPTTYRLTVRSGVLEVTHVEPGHANKTQTQEPPVIRIDRAVLIHYLVDGPNGAKIPGELLDLLAYIDLPWRAK